MPPVTPTSYEALAVSYGLEMLAASASFRTQVGASTSDGAKAWIVNGLGGLPNEAGSDDDEQKAINCLGTSFVIAGNSWAVIHMPDAMQAEQVGHREYVYSGRIDIIVTVPVLADEQPNDQVTRGRNLLGAIRTEIEAQFGQSGKLLNGYVTSQGPSLQDETGALRGDLDFKISIHWQDV